MNTSLSSEQDSARKPSPFDNLSREELVKKCKGLLGIAQKAKQVKDECLEENRHLKEQLSHFETQKNADKECIKAMQEVADSYMDQKLHATMRVDELEKQLDKLKAQLVDEQTSHEKKEEELRADMVQLKKKLALLEQDVEDRGKNDSTARMRELEEENTKLEKERVALEQELIKVKGSQKALNDTSMSAREEKLIRKLKLYKAKVQEINAKLLLLKSDRKILLKTVKEYSDQVPKWQKELVNASNVLFDKIRTIELEKSDLIEKLSKQELLTVDLEANNEELSRQLAALQNSTPTNEGENGLNCIRERHESLIDELRKQVDHLNAQNADMAAENQRSLSEYETKLHHDSNEKENLQKDLQEVNRLVSEFEKKIQTQASLLSDSKHAQTKLNEQLEESNQRAEQFEKEVKQLQKLLQKNTENIAEETPGRDLSRLEEQLANSENEKNRIAGELHELSKQAETMESLKTHLNETLDKLTAMEKHNENLQKQVTALEKSATAMAAENLSHEKMAKKMEENQTVVQKLIVENQNLEAQLGQLADKLKCSIAESKKALEHNVLLEKELETTKEQLEKLSLDKTRMLDELNEIKTRETEIASEKEKLLQLSSVYKEENQKYEATNKAVRQRLDDLENELASAHAKYERFQSENGELLSELKEINEILKERGEVINLQVAKISELQEKLSCVGTANVEMLKNQIEQLAKTLTEKETELERQRDELAAIKDRSNISFDAQSDVMSTSTISRVEDVARMREIDESFEEKYIKLRSLAVKLKKKVAEQTLLLQKYEKESSAVGTTVIPGPEVDTAQQIASKNLQTLQAENDRLQDQLESVRQEMGKLREELDRKTVELATLEQMQRNAEDSSKDRSTLESAIREYQTQIQSLKREKEAFQLVKREIDMEIQRLKSSLKAKEKELADEQEQQKDLKSELDRTKLAVKKANVLSLEMEAYERSLNELNSKLEGKKTLVRELEGKIDLQEQSMKSLKQQVALLEESLDSQQKHSRELKQEADTQQGKLRHSEHQRMELTGQLEELREEQDRLKQRVENNRVELEQVAAEKEQVCGSLEVEKNNLLKKNLTLESELGDLRKAAAEKQQEVEDVRTEFASYKIRAQSVLRQNQNKDSSREKELEEELGQVQRSLESVEAKQQVLLKQNGDLSKGNEELRSEKERTQNRCKELLALLEECRLQNESLLDESRRTNLDHQETLKTQRIQGETMIQCYKKQLEDQQQVHCREMEQLRTTIRHRSDTIIDGPNASRTNNNTFTSLSHHPMAGGRSTGFTDEQRINLLLMEREEGEGSESTSQGAGGGPTNVLRRKLSSSSAARGRSNREIIPLDELLNSSFEDTASVVLGDGDGDHQHSFFGRESSPTIELQHTKEQLGKQESRVRHLTAVLAEAEQDLAKLTQLNELLKEEVRRQQRSIEREAHAHNSEYLKNVIFKFITLNNGDERSRLVPVLNTILKLSPEETQKLQNVAKGSEPGSRGWTGLLWS